MAAGQEEQPSQPAAPLWQVWRWPMHWQVLLGIGLGVVFGTISGLTPGMAGRVDGFLYDLFGTWFKNGLRMLVVPLVALSIISALAGLGQQRGFARLGGKTLLYYICTSLVAVLIGLTLVNLIAPGVGIDFTPEEAAAAVAQEGSAEAGKQAFLQERTAGRGLADSLNVLKEIIPANPFAAAVAGDMLGVIFFSLLVGFFIGRLPEGQRELMTRIADGGFEIMLGITFLVLRFLPLGVLCLIAMTTADTVADGNVGERLQQLLKFAVTVLLALGLHFFLVMPLILSLVARVPPWRHYGAMWPALITAFSTASSSATLPLTMECVEERAGVSKRVTSFVLPVGATVNMDGTALYECVAVIFLAQLAGIDLSFGQQFTVVALALLTSIGVAGIPSASLVAIVIILQAVNGQLEATGQQIPIETLAIILVFDRLLDMCRTAVNVFGDSCGAVVVARSEGEEQVLVQR